MQAVSPPGSRSNTCLATQASCRKCANRTTLRLHRVQRPAPLPLLRMRGRPRQAFCGWRCATLPRRRAGVRPNERLPHRTLCSSSSVPRDDHSPATTRSALRLVRQRGWWRWPPQGFRGKSVPAQDHNRCHGRGRQEEHEAVVHPGGGGGGYRPGEDVREARGPREAAEALAGHEQPAELPALVLRNDARRGDRQREHDLLFSSAKRRGHHGENVCFGVFLDDQPLRCALHPPTLRHAVASFPNTAPLGRIKGGGSTLPSSAWAPQKRVCPPSAIINPSYTYNPRRGAEKRPPPFCTSPLRRGANQNSHTRSIAPGKRHPQTSLRKSRPCPPAKGRMNGQTTVATGSPRANERTPCSAPPCPALPHRANAADRQDVAQDRHGEEAALVPAEELGVRDGQKHRHAQQAAGALPAHDARVPDRRREEAELQDRQDDASQAQHLEPKEKKWDTGARARVISETCCSNGKDVGRNQSVR